MANTYDKVVAVISKKPEQRQEFEIQGLLQWFRKKSKIFSTLKTECLKDIVRNCGVRTYKRDDIIIKQGEIGDCFYIILGGKISIYIINKDKDAGGGDGDEKDALNSIGTYKDGKLDRSKCGNFVTSLGSGFPFGEVALVSDDAIRTASIITEEDNTDLLVVDRALYNRAVRDVLAAEFEEKRTFIKSNDLFKSWMGKYKKQLTMAMYKETFQYDTVLVKQGEQVGNIYFIISGQVEVRTDPSFHTVQYPKLYKLQEDERDKLIKEKRSKRSASDSDNLPHVAKRDMARTIKMCYIGKNETIGELEVLMDMDTHMTTAVCVEKTEVLVLEMKHYERLFVKRHQRTIDTMRRKLEMKLNTRSSILKERDEIPLLKLVQLKLHLQHNPPQSSNEKKRKPTTSVKCAERLFFSHQGPLLDIDGPGSVFYMIRAREKSRLKFKAHQKERSNVRQGLQNGHVHAIRLPQTLLMAAQMAGALGTDAESSDIATDTANATTHSNNAGYKNDNLENSVIAPIRSELHEIEAVAAQNSPLQTPDTNSNNRLNSAKDTSLPNVDDENLPRAFRRVQSAAKAKSNQKENAHSHKHPDAHRRGRIRLKPLSTSRPGTRLENYSVDNNLRELEAKVEEWLRKDNPRGGPKVSKLRRIHVEEMEPRPKPGNKIIVRKRPKVHLSESSTDTGGSVTSLERSDDRTTRCSSAKQSETSSLNRFKILLHH